MYAVHAIYTLIYRVTDLPTDLLYRGVLGGSNRARRRDFCPRPSVPIPPCSIGSTTLVKANQTLVINQIIPTQLPNPTKILLHFPKAHITTPGPKVRSRFHLRPLRSRDRLYLPTTVCLLPLPSARNATARAVCNLHKCVPLLPLTVLTIV